MTTVTSFITITNESGIEKNIHVFGNASLTPLLLWKRHMRNYGY